MIKHYITKYEESGKRYLSGLECIGGKYYFIPDVATQIMNDRSIKDEKV